MQRFVSLGIFAWLLAAQTVVAQDRVNVAQADELIHAIIKAAGDEKDLLRRFQIQERLNVSDDPEAALGKPRESVFDGHDHWWFRAGKGAWKKKENEPAVNLVWVWTLQAFLDEKSKITLLPEIVDGEATCVGLRISESITPPLDAYFNKETLRLTRIDWRKDIHRFSDWKEADKVFFPARCIGYRKETGKPWYVSQISELNRLETLPDELTR
jgi:hypothetical protein